MDDRKSWKKYTLAHILSLPKALHLLEKNGKEGKGMRRLLISSRSPEDTYSDKALPDLDAPAPAPTSCQCPPCLLAQPQRPPSSQPPSTLLPQPCSCVRHFCCLNTPSTHQTTAGSPLTSFRLFLEVPYLVRMSQAAPFKTAPPRPCTGSPPSLACSFPHRTDHFLPYHSLLLYSVSPHLSQN